MLELCIGRRLTKQTTSRFKRNQFRCDSDKNVFALEILSSDDIISAVHAMHSAQCTHTSSLDFYVCHHSSSLAKFKSKLFDFRNKFRNESIACNRLPNSTSIEYGKFSFRIVNIERCKREKTTILFLNFQCFEAFRWKHEIRKCIRRSN